MAHKDLNSAKISQNRVGLLTGVEAKYDAGVIDSSTRDEIKYIITEAATEYFRPIIYVIN